MPSPHDDDSNDGNNNRAKTTSDETAESNSRSSLIGEHVSLLASEPKRPAMNNDSKDSKAKARSRLPPASQPGAVSVASNEIAANSISTGNSRMTSRRNSALTTASSDDDDDDEDASSVFLEDEQQKFQTAVDEKRAYRQAVAAVQPGAQQVRNNPTSDDNGSSSHPGSDMAVADEKAHYRSNHAPAANKPGAQMVRNTSTGSGSNGSTISDEKAQYRQRTAVVGATAAAATTTTTTTTTAPATTGMADAKARYRATNRTTQPGVTAERNLPAEPPQTSLTSQTSSSSATIVDEKAKYRRQTSSTSSADEPPSTTTTNSNTKNGLPVDEKAKYRRKPASSKPGSFGSASEPAAPSTSSDAVDEKANYRRKTPSSRPGSVSSASEPATPSTSDDVVDEKAKYRQTPSSKPGASASFDNNKDEPKDRGTPAPLPIVDNIEDEKAIYRAAPASRPNNIIDSQDEKEALRSYSRSSEPGVVTMAAAAAATTGATTAAILATSENGNAATVDDEKAAFRNGPSSRPNDFRPEATDSDERHNPDVSLSTRDIEALAAVAAMTAAEESRSPPSGESPSDDEPKAGDGVNLTPEAKLQYAKAQSSTSVFDDEVEDKVASELLTAEVRSPKERAKSVMFDDDGTMLLKATLAPSEDTIRENIANEIREQLVNQAADDIRNQALHDMDVVVGEVLMEGDEEEEKLTEMRKRNTRIYAGGILLCLIVIVVTITVSVVLARNNNDGSELVYAPTPSPTLSLSPTTSPVTAIPTSSFPSNQPSIRPTYSAMPSSEPSVSAMPSSQPSNFRIKVEIELLTDQYPEETTIFIDSVDDTNVTTLVTRRFKSSEIFRYTTTETYLFAGRYNFWIDDSFGDGICCQNGFGGYRILFDGVERATGAQFTRFELIEIEIGEDGEVQVFPRRWLNFLLTPETAEVETLEELELVDWSGQAYANDQGLLLLGECQGHCASHDSCPGQMKCSSPDWPFEIPGCDNEFREDGVRYCFNPQTPDRSLLPHNSSLDQLAPLGICEGGCMSNNDCYGDLACFVSDGAIPVPGCDGMVEGGFNYCAVDPENASDLAIVASRGFFEHQPLYPLGRCHGGCVSDEDCAGNLECFTDVNSIVIPGCKGIGGSGYCYDPMATALDESLYQIISPLVGDGERRLLDSALGENGWQAFYKPGAIVGKLTVWVSNFPRSIGGISVTFSDDYIVTMGRASFASFDNQTLTTSPPERIDFEFGENDRLRIFKICSTEDGKYLAYVSISTTAGNELEVGACLDPASTQEFDVSDGVLAGFVALTTTSIKSLAPLTRQKRFCDDGEDWTEINDHCYYNSGTTESFSSCEALCQELNAAAPCIYDPAMNNFLATEFGPQPLWVGMARGSLYRWSSSTCLSDYYNWYRSSFEVDPIREHCVSLEGGNSVVEQTTGIDGVIFDAYSGGGVWKETPCESDKVQCICEKPHPVKTTPRGHRPSETVPDDAYQVYTEYSLDTQIRSLDSQEAAAIEWGGHLASVLSEQQNNAFLNLEYDGALFFTAPEPLDQYDCNTYCGTHNAESPCIVDQEMEEYLITTIENSFWAGFDNQNNGGRFGWRNRGCNSVYASIPRELEADSACMSIGPDSQPGDDWFVTSCFEQLTCVCMIEDPCPVTSNDLSSNGTAFDTTSLVSIGVKYDESISSFEWFDGMPSLYANSSFSGYANFISAPQTFPDQVGVGILGTGEWVVTSPGQKACAARSRPKQYLRAEIVKEDMSTFTINMVPEVPLIEESLKSSSLHHTNRFPGTYQVINGAALEVFGTRRVTYDLKPLLSVVRQGFELSLEFDFQSIDNNCLSKVCSLGACWGKEEYSTTSERVLIQPNGVFGSNSLLIIEQNCIDSKQGLSTLSNLIFKAKSAYLPKFLTSTYRKTFYDFSSYPLEDCFGGCSTSDDCAGDLTCFHRENPGRINGCPGTSYLDWGYCSAPIVEALNVSLPNETVCEDRRTFTLELRTDTFGNDISWEIVSTDDSVVAAYGSGFGSNSEYIYTGCLEERSYKFIIYDFHGDGICCGNGEGLYILIVDGTYVSLSPGDEFWNEREATFTVKSNSLDLVLPPESDCNKTNSFSVSLLTDQYGGETSWDIVTAGSNSSSRVAYASGYPSNTPYYHEGCLEDGDYVFTIYDSFGDGIFDPGTYVFQASGFNVATWSQGSFRILSYPFAVPVEYECSEGYPVCPDFPQRAYCEGTESNCALDMCDCAIGQDFCDTGINPCRPSTPTPSTSPSSTCIDQNDDCEFWASIGECAANPEYMLVSCAKSCNQC